MKKQIRNALFAAAVLGPSGTAFAHHGSADDLGGQLVHATFDPSHLAVTILAAGAIIAALGVARAIRRRR